MLLNFLLDENVTNIDRSLSDKELKIFSYYYGK